MEPVGGSRSAFLVEEVRFLMQREMCRTEEKEEIIGVRAVQLGMAANRMR